MAKEAQIAVVGSGHVGTVTAACMAELGHRVVAVDIDDALVSRLNACDLPFIEPGLTEIVQRQTGRGRLRFLGLSPGRRRRVWPARGA